MEGGISGIGLQRIIVESLAPCEVLGEGRA
jgi:hypothetical protein